MSGNLNGWTGLIVLAVVLLLFGAPKLPGLAKSLGQSLKIFRSEVRSESKAGSSEEKTSPKNPPSSRK